jgi:hypothetical protein
MRLLDVDLNQPDIWEEGFSVIEGWLDRISA